jgi:glutamate/tyrosine decarboxylase-like PLP-dependent enzyme
MDADALIQKLGNLNPKLVAVIEKYLNKLPGVRKEIDKQTDEVMKDLEGSVRPYTSDYTTFKRLPNEGVNRDNILSDMESMAALEKDRWKDGYVSGTVYHGNEEHISFLNKVYATNSQANPLHSDLFPSTSKYEAEIISMTAGMLGADNAEEEICGSVSSGGTESILLAMKTYRDRARVEKNIKRPEMVVPVTAHAAFNKAAQYFNIKLKQVPIGKDFKVDVKAVKRAINSNTIVIVGSAPTFPHGVVDHIEELSSLAAKKKVGLHVDACLGGFMLPWIKQLDYNVPEFDFSLKGVTSMSADTHKYGYAAKGTSVVLYRSLELRRYQYFTITDWPGGLYFSPTFAGSRAGALSAACWASLVSLGEKGYLDAAREIMKTADVIKNGIRAIPELDILGDPLWNISFGSKELDIYRVMDYMTERKWSLNGLHKPSCVHICCTLRHAQDGVGEKFVADLEEAVSHVKSTPAKEGGMAPVYGMAATLPLRGTISHLLKKYMDVLYKV